jgi:hypothetical protein
MAVHPKQYADDDGRVICNMDVDGMPWHDKRVRRERREQQRAIAAGQTDREQMTKAEARRFTFHAVLAGLLIAAVFSAAWVLFVLFCTQVWFR